MALYKSKLKTILMVYKNEIIKIEQTIAAVMARRQACEGKIAYESKKEEVLRGIIEAGGPIDSSSFLSAFSSSYDFKLQEELEGINKEIRELNLKRHEVSKKKDWLIDEDKKREAFFIRDEFKKEERRAEGDGEGYN